MHVPTHMCTYTHFTHTCISSHGHTHYAPPPPHTEGIRDYRAGELHAFLCVKYVYMYSCIRICNICHTYLSYVYVIFVIRICYLYTYLCLYVLRTCVYLWSNLWSTSVCFQTSPPHSHPPTPHTPIPPHPKHPTYTHTHKPTQLCPPPLWCPTS